MNSMESTESVEFVEYLVILKMKLCRKTQWVVVWLKMNMSSGPPHPMEPELGRHYHQQ